MYVHDATEQAHLNGQGFMQKKILEMLRRWKGRALGQERAIISEVIEMIEKLEVR